MTQVPPSSTAPSDIDQRRARTALVPLEPWILGDGLWTFDLTDGDGKTHKVEIPAIVAALFLDALKETAAGKAVSIVTAEAEVTTQQAATILKVSRPLVVSLVEDGRLAARKVGNRWRIPLQDVLEYKAENGPKRRASPSTEMSTKK